MRIPPYFTFCILPVTLWVVLLATPALATLNPPTLSLILRGVTAVAAILAAGVAFYGVNTWRRQLIGQNEYELARRILALAYDLEWLYRQSRSVFYDGSEEIREQLSKTGRRFDRAFRQGRAHWDLQFYELREPFRQWHNTLSYSKKWLDDMRHDRLPESEQVHYHKYAAIASRRDDDTDDFSVQFRKMLSDLEKFLRPKINW